MEQLKQVIQTMIQLSDWEFDTFYSGCQCFTHKKNDIISRQNVVPNEIFFVQKGLIRVFITDDDGMEHTIHFAMENQFIADYSHYLLQAPSVYALQALEATEIISIPRSAIDWGYSHMEEGNKLGRLIAEYYFMYQDERINNRYIRTPKERYDLIETIFPNIHQRAPQHLIASYLGITPIHLSRLKKTK
jgi:CRP-like cAMP-binding protein